MFLIIEESIHRESLSLASRWRAGELLKRWSPIGANKGRHADSGDALPMHSSAQHCTNTYTFCMQCLSKRSALVFGSFVSCLWPTLMFYTRTESRFETRIHTTIIIPFHNTFRYLYRNKYRFDQRLRLRKAFVFQSQPTYRPILYWQRLPPLMANTLILLMLSTKAMN